MTKYIIALAGFEAVIFMNSSGNVFNEEQEAAGYDGCCEVEIFSENNWWKKDPDQVLKTCIERHQRVV